MSKVQFWITLYKLLLVWTFKAWKTRVLRLHSSEMTWECRTGHEQRPAAGISPWRKWAILPNLWALSPGSQERQKYHQYNPHQWIRLWKKPWEEKTVWEIKKKDYFLPRCIFSGKTLVTFTLAIKRFAAVRNIENNTYESQKCFTIEIRWRRWEVSR